MGVVNREAAQEPRDRTSSQSWSSDSRKRCAGSDAIVVVRGAWKLGEGRSNEVENAKSYTNLRAAERKCFRRALGLFAPPCPTLFLSLRHTSCATSTSTRRVQSTSKSAEIKCRQRRTPQDSRFSEHLAKLTRQRPRDGGGRPRTDLRRRTLHNHPERRSR